MKTPKAKTYEGEIIEQSGPIMPVEVARDIWIALHKTRNESMRQPAYVLEPSEERLYQHLTHRLEMESSIVGVKVTANPPND